MIDVGLYLSYLLLVVALGATLVFPFLYALKHPDVFKKSLVGIGALVVLFGISYALSGSTVSLSAAALGVTETSSKFIGAGLTMFYFTLGIAIIGLIYSEINKATK